MSTSLLPYKLPLRLRALLERALPGEPVWDLCCDHGHLGLAALASGLYPEVVFNDVVPHVLEDLRRRLPSFSDDIKVRVECGPAESLAFDLTGTVIIAGVGSRTMLRICNALNTRQVLKAKRLLFCPEKNAYALANTPLEGFWLSETVTIVHGQGSRIILRFDAVDPVEVLERVCVPSESVLKNYLPQTT